MHYTQFESDASPLTLTLSPVGERGPETKSRWNVAIVLLFVFINGLVLVNAIRHDPAIGYDAEHHLRYVRSLAIDGRLPTRGNSREFFSPPAPYVVPAIVARALVGFGEESAVWYGAKAGQFVNVLASIGLTFALLQLCELARPGDARFKGLALLLLAMLPVYYKSFAFLRGEPLLACFAIMATVQFFRIVASDASIRRAVMLGGLLGLCILSRQWGFFLFPALAIAALVTWRARPHRRNAAIAKCAAIAAVVALLVGGWFYAVLYARYSTVIAFNRDPQPGNLFTTQPASFFTSLHVRELFTSPTRGAFPNRLLPIFYAETWGDYWGYFVSDRDGGPTPRDRYLGRVNVLSILPSALLLAGAGYGLWRLARSALSRTIDAQALLHATCGAVVLCSVLGYGWFLLRYPNDKGDTIKATYMLHVFPLLAVLAAAILSRMRGRARRAAVAALVALIIHNLPAMITRYVAS